MSLEDWMRQSKYDGSFDARDGLKQVEDAPVEGLSMTYDPEKLALL